jgi:HlyD family secretion protein
MKHLRLAVLSVAALAVAAGVSYVAPKSAPEYITAPVERGSISSFVLATGSVQPIVSVDVSSQLSGRVAEVFVDFNDAVKAGQPLARLDQDSFTARVSETKAELLVATANLKVQQAAVERAQVAVENAQTSYKISQAQAAGVQIQQAELERELKRQVALARIGGGMGRDVDQARAARDSGATDQLAAQDQIEQKSEAITMAQAELSMAEANVQDAEAVTQQQQATLDQAEVDLARSVIRAPIDGVIIKRDINPGQTVAVSLDAKTLFTIANDLRSMEVQGTIDEADIGRLRPGQDVRFTVDAYPDRTFTGHVLQIRKSPEIIQDVVTYTAIISAPNPDLLLYPGMTAMLRIVVSDSAKTLLIPNQALSFRPNGTAAVTDAQAETAALAPGGAATIWVVNAAGRPAPVAVTLGPADENNTALLAGPLKEGQQVIVGFANSPAQTGHWGIRLEF